MYKKIVALALLAASLQAEKIVVIDIEGMTCPLCTVAVKHSLKKTAGVIKAKVKLSSRKATLTVNDDVNESELLNAIKKAGYRGKINSLKVLK